MTSSAQKVFVSRQIPLEALEHLQKANFVIDKWDYPTQCPRERLLEAVQDVHGLYCTLSDKIDKELTDNAKNLKVISTMSVGYDHIDLTALRSRGIKLGYTPGVLTEATAELAVALLLSVTRRLIEASRTVKQGLWEPWQPMWMCGTGIYDSTVGVVGMGRIGQSVAVKLSAFNPRRILYCGPTDKRVPYADYVSLQRLLAESDFVVVTCALNAATKEMFNSETFSAMKRTAVFVNVSRGGVVNQWDLCDALRDGVIGAAGLDVTSPEPLGPDHPLLALDNCIVLPHIGSATMRTRTEMATLAARNLVNGLTGVPIEEELML